MSFSSSSRGKKKLRRSRLNPQADESSSDFRIQAFSERSARGDSGGSEPDPKNIFSRVTRKDSAILSKIPDKLKNKVLQKIPVGREQQKKLETLLHFSGFKLGSTTQESRLAIRSILMIAIGQGMSYKKAESLKTMLHGADASIAINLLNDLQTLDNDGVKTPPDTFIINRILRSISKPTDADLLHIADSLSEMLPSLENIGEDFGKADTLRLVRGTNGKILAIRDKVLFESLEIPASNRDLSDDQVSGIRDTFQELLDETTYNKAATALDFISFFSDLRSKNPDITMRQAMILYHPDGRDTVRRYKGADCIGLAEELVERLNEKGIKAFLAGQSNEGLLQLSVPGNRDLITWPSAPKHTEFVNHVDVIIPYTDSAGNEKLLQFVTGMGRDPKYKISFDNFSSALNALSVKQYLVQKTLNGGALQNPGLTSQRALAARSKFFIMKDVDQTQAFGIDLLAGDVFLNTRAADQFKGVKPTEGRVTFNFIDALKNPSDMVEIQGREIDNKRVPVRVRKIDALMVFLEAVQQDFAQPDTFVQDMLNLLANRQTYCDEVLLPPAGAIAATWSESTAALNALERVPESQRSNFNRFMEQAQEAIMVNDRDTAREKYLQASRLAN